MQELCLQECPFNAKINVQCAKLAVQVDTRGVSKHFIANVDGMGAEIRDWQIRMEEHEYRKSGWKIPFILMDPRCVNAFQGGDVCVGKLSTFD